MNTLRLLVFLGVIIGAVYGSLWAVATFLEPQPRTISVSLGKIRLP